ncbi:unnamed protein product, partial [marine sediment metagenome]
ASTELFHNITFISADGNYSRDYNSTQYYYDSSTGSVTLNVTLENGLNRVNYGFFLDNCSLYNTTSLNVSFLNENSNPVNINYEATVTYWYINSSNTKSYSTSTNSINNTMFCVYPSWISITGDIQIKYTDSDNNIYDYFIFQHNFNDTIRNLNLFTQNGTTQVLFTVQTLDTTPVPDAYIHILKYNVGTGIYTTTEVIRTDSQGQSLGNIVLATTFYNFLIYYQGNLIYTESGVKLITTTRTFTVSLEGTTWADNFQ